MRAASTPPSVRRQSRLPLTDAEKERERSAIISTKRSTLTTPTKPTTTITDRRNVSGAHISREGMNLPYATIHTLLTAPSTAEKSAKQHSSDPNFQHINSGYSAVATRTPDAQTTKPIDNRLDEDKSGLGNFDVASGMRNGDNNIDCTYFQAVPSRPRSNSINGGQATSVAATGPTSRPTPASSSDNVAQSTPKKGAGSTYSTPMKGNSSRALHSSPSAVLQATPSRLTPRASKRINNHYEPPQPPNLPSTVMRTPSRSNVRPIDSSASGFRSSPQRLESEVNTFVNPVGPDQGQGQRKTPDKPKKLDNTPNPKLLTTPLRKKKSVTVIGKSPVGLRGSKALKKIPQPAEFESKLTGDGATSVSMSISCIRRVDEDDDELSSSTWGFGLSSKSQSLGTSLWEGDLQQMSLLDFEDNEEQHREERMGRAENDEDEEEIMECRLAPDNLVDEPFVFSPGTGVPLFDLSVDMDVDLNLRDAEFDHIRNQSRIQPDPDQSRNCLGDSFYQQQSLPYEASLLSLHITDTISAERNYYDCEDEVLFEYNDAMAVKTEDTLQIIPEGEAEVAQDSSTCSSSSTVSVSSTLRMIRRLGAAGVDQSCFSPLDSIRSLDFSSPSFREEGSCLIGQFPTFGYTTSTVQSISPSNNIISKSCSAEGCVSDEVSSETERDTHESFLELDQAFLGHRSQSLSSSYSNNSTNQYTNATMMTNMSLSRFQSSSLDLVGTSSKVTVPVPVPLPPLDLLSEEQSRESWGLTPLHIPNGQDRGSQEKTDCRSSPERERDSSLTPSTVSLDVLSLSSPETAMSPTFPLPGPSMSLTQFSPAKGPTQRWSIDDRANQGDTAFKVDTQRPKVRVSKYTRGSGRQGGMGRESGKDIIFAAPSSSFISITPHTTISEGSHYQPHREERYTSLSPSPTSSPSPRYISMDSFADSEYGHRPFLSLTAPTTFPTKTVSTSPLPSCALHLSAVSRTPESSLSSTSVSLSSAISTGTPSLSQSVQEFLSIEATTKFEAMAEAEEAEGALFSQSTRCSTSILDKVGCKVFPLAGLLTKIMTLLLT